MVTGLRFGPEPVEVAVAGIGEPDGPVAADHDVLRRAQRQPAPVVDDHALGPGPRVHSRDRRRLGRAALRRAALGRELVPISPGVPAARSRCPRRFLRPMMPIIGPNIRKAPVGRISSSWSTRVESPCAVRTNRCPPCIILRCGTIRTRSGRENSCSSWTTLPNPRRSHSNCVPSRTSPVSRRREARTVGFHAAKLPPSTIASNTSLAGALIIWEWVMTANVSSRSAHRPGTCRRVGYGSEFSFSKAFKRAFGISPGAYRGQPDQVPVLTPAPDAAAPAQVAYRVVGSGPWVAWVPGRRRVRRHDRGGSRVSSRRPDCLVPLGRAGHRDAIEETQGRGAALRRMKRPPRASTHS